MRADDAVLTTIVATLQAQLAAGAERLEVDVLDPDYARGAYAGERVIVDGNGYVHRPLRSWFELADRLGLRLRTPRAIVPPLLRLTFERLADQHALPTAEARADTALDITERYGATSTFARVRKFDEPGFVLDLADAWDRVALAPGARVLELGCGRGDLRAWLHTRTPAVRYVGIDHSASALAMARAQFAADDAATTRFVDADLTNLAALDALALDRFDLIVCIGTLQSHAIDDRSLLRTLLTRHLTPRGALILGIPNCRYQDGELRHGARLKNFRQAELGLVIKDVAYYRRYLQQHHRKVFVTGQHELLVTAIVDGP